MEISEKDYLITKYENKYQSKIDNGTLNKCYDDRYKVTEQFNDIHKIRCTVRGSTAKELAERIATKYLEERESYDTIKKQGLNFGDIAEEWFRLKIEGRDLSIDNKKNYVGVLNNHILPEFDNTGILDIKNKDILYFLNKKAESYSYSHIKKMRDTLAAIFKYAYANQYIDYNPCIDVTVPKSSMVVDTKNQPFNDSDLKLAFRAVKSNPHTVLMLSMFFMYGMRPVELINLKWKNINFEKNYIHIEVSKYTYAITTTNIESTIRYLPLSNTIKKLLQNEQQQQKRLNLYSEDGYIFHKTNNINMKLTTKELDKYFKTIHRKMDILNGAVVKNNKIIKSTNIRAFTPYVFRKGVSTELTSMDVPTPFAQAFIGHKPTTVIGKHYTKLTYEKDLKNHYKEYIDITESHLIDIFDNIGYKTES